MFESLEQEDPRNAVRCFASLFLSLVVHAAIVSVILVLPLVFFNMLHADELVTFLIQPPYKLPEAPVPPAPPVRTAATGIAAIIERFDPVPHKLPTGIPAPDESKAPSVLSSLLDGIGLPGQGSSSGPGLSEILDIGRIVDVPKPKPPVPHILVRVGGDVQESKLLLKVVPVYPALAIVAHAAGIVILEAEIDEEGNVATVKIVSGHPLLVNAAAQAVKQWKYSPTLLNGEPQAVLATVTVVFRLK
jgi:protein TonB